MIFTLALNSNSILTNNRITEQLKAALNMHIFDRCQLSLKTSDGIIWLNAKERNEFQRCLSVIQESGIDLILSIACFEDKSNKSREHCVIEAGINKDIEKLTRICPSNRLYRDRLKELIEKARESHFFGEDFLVHLSYFRFEHFSQCVCPTCLKNFFAYRKAKGKDFHYRDHRSLTNQKVILDWVHWRQNVITEAARELSLSAQGKLSLEIDFDETKRYLAGPAIEEGLNLKSILKHLREIYYHIEPCKSKADWPPLIRWPQPHSYMNHLIYLVSECHLSNVKAHFFFWFLSKYAHIKYNLRQYLLLARAVKPDGLVLYTDKPLVIARNLSDLAPHI
ncbi:MAG: hypothetical protein JSV88_20005 [Candidatus Aminicenantes bacterium]|nr:MAG: hypothetical protein JSV88_20005 [Candidatus Aminicenantes bacterium]